MDRSDPAYRGQADYSPLLLKLYDPIVIGVVARLVWRFRRLAAGVYRAWIRDRHLDVVRARSNRSITRGSLTAATSPSSTRTRTFSGTSRGAFAG